MHSQTVCRWPQIIHWNKQPECCCQFPGKFEFNSLLVTTLANWNISNKKLHFRSRDSTLHSHQPFTCGNTVLTSPLTVRDLGIIVDPHLKFTNHIFEIVKKANQRAALIHRSFLSKNPTNLILAYKIYVRPLLEYASPVWNPSQINLINTLEAVQRKFTKRIPGLSDITYSERLKILNLLSLEHRRLQFDLVTCFKIVHTHLCLEAIDFFTFSPNNRSRGHPYRLIVPLVKSNIKKHFFSCRVVHPWNSLPSTLVTNSNIIHFKPQFKTN